MRDNAFCCSMHSSADPRPPRPRFCEEGLLNIIDGGGRGAKTASDIIIGGGPSLATAALEYGRKAPLATVAGLVQPAADLEARLGSGMVPCPAMQCASSAAKLQSAAVALFSRRRTMLVCADCLIISAVFGRPRRSWDAQVTPWRELGRATPPE